MSGSSGGVDGNDFGVWATNVPPALGPPERRGQPRRPFPHTDPTPRPCAPLCPPMSGGGGGVDGDAFGVWATNVPPPLGT
jgi:hypothetical protein